MKTLVSILSTFAAGAAQAHESLVPHTHPHGVSMLPGIETIGVAALVLAVTVIVIAQFKRW
ncbi:MAG: hypothetical protein HYX37_18690 [Rhizobiales bacterium]|jgi:hypothetical protein|nr:hypothetical protein [Hyphomicrobiales bacterium]